MYMYLCQDEECGQLIGQEEAEMKQFKCPACGGPMDKLIDDGSVFLRGVEDLDESSYCDSPSCDGTCDTCTEHVREERERQMEDDMDSGFVMVECHKCHCRYAEDLQRIFPLNNNNVFDPTQLECPKCNSFTPPVNDTPEEDDGIPF